MYACGFLLGFSTRLLALQRGEMGWVEMYIRAVLKRVPRREQERNGDRETWL